MKGPVAAALAAALVTSPAVAGAADSVFGPISVGLNASTLGGGIVLERPLLFNLSGRVTTGLLSTTDQRTVQGGPWRSTFHQGNVLVTLDWRPGAGRYRMSGGLLFGSDHLDYVAEPDGATTYAINGNRYSVAAAGTVSTRIDFGGRPALYVGVGAGTGIYKGLAMTYDVGLVLRNGVTTTNASGPLRNDPRFQADLAALGGSFQTRILSPVFSVGLVYRP